jgi:hypothetical protein
MTSTSTEHKAQDADPDAIQAKIDLSVSKARSLVQSWLPASTSGSPPDKHSDTDDEAPAPPRHVLSDPFHRAGFKLTIWFMQAGSRCCNS